MKRNEELLNARQKLKIISCLGLSLDLSLYPAHGPSLTPSTYHFRETRVRSFATSGPMESNMYI
jgi:hypothetical protein